MKTKHLFLLPALAFLACAGLHAQVTIGGLTEATPGAILDLNSTGGVRGGLLLSNVTLTNLRTIPGEISAAAAINDEATKKAQFTGAIVYHTGGNDIAAGVYLWNGKRWTPAGSATTVKDAQNNEYSIAEFGAAGTWMTQNLRSTQYADGTPLMELTEETSIDVIHKRYTYPGTSNSYSEREAVFTSDPELLKAYGLLYSWAAASGRTTIGTGIEEANNASQDKYQGICPKDWHLPSDWEWIQLEKEIAASPQKYSSQEVAYTYAEGDRDFDAMGSYRPLEGNNTLTDVTATYWGRQMKSTECVGTTIDTKGSSFPREEGGFDALLVGGVDNNGSTSNYGLRAHFWSSSTYNSNGMYRYLPSSHTGMARNGILRGYLFSVRCKKD